MKNIEAIFFACNDNSQKHKDMSINMIKSGKHNLSEIPFYCLYDGNDDIYMSKLNNLNVNLIQTKVSIINDINKSKNLSEGEKKIASGAYLRIDIGRHSSNYKCVLYVDCDVIFVKNIINDNFEYFNNDYIFASCSENNWNYKEYLNTGVMLINLDEYKKHYNNFIKFIVERDFKFPAYDQGAINDYFKGKFYHLDNNYNYKPYWIRKHDFKNAKIIHYHGLKPYFLEDIVKNKEQSFIYINKVIELIDLINIWGGIDNLIYDSENIFLKIYNKYNYDK